jgi:F0F1-type ATP synthase assembly protein I
MHFLIKLLASVAIIVLSSQIARKLPTLGGLIATMPLTGVIVMLWLYSDHPGNFPLMQKYTKGAVFGILPSILFFITACICFNKHLPLSLVLAISFGVWMMGACIHQWFLH